MERTLCDQVAVLILAGSLGGCGGSADRPGVLPPYDPRGADASGEAGPGADPALEGEIPAVPVRLDPWTTEARCGRWFCADQLPRSGSAVAVGDFDGDGRPDLLLADTGRLLSTLGPLTLLHNDGGMRFSDATRRAGLEGYGAWSAIFGDLDNDGDDDLVLGGRRQSEPVGESGDVLVFYNDGRGRFTRVVTVPRWGAGVPLALDLADMNVDGRLDILVAPAGTNVRETYAPRVLEGGLDGNFTAQTGGLNDEGFAWVTLATDLNGDQRPDVLTAHDGHAIHQGTPEEGGVVGCTAPEGPRTAAWLNAAYRNDGAAGEFAMAVQSADVQWTDARNTPMSLVRGDFDADGRIDLLTTQTDNPLLFRVTPAGVLESRTAWPGDWRYSDAGGRGVGWGALARDLDRDGDEDALVAYGVIPGTTTTWPNTVYLNGRASGLARAAEGTGFERTGEWSALAAADFDGDGDDDLVLGAQTLFRRPCDGEAGRALLLTNVSEWPGRHWLRVRLVGTVSNRDGLGARVEATAGGVTLAREVSRSGSTMSSSARVADFGLGGSASVDALVVRWPSGAVQVLRNVAGDREITVQEPRWLGVDSPRRRSQEPVTVRLAAAQMGSAAVRRGPLRLELRGNGRWLVPPIEDAATGDLVGRFTGMGRIWVRTVGPGAGLGTAVRVRFDP